MVKRGFKVGKNQAAGRIRDPYVGWKIEMGEGRIGMEYPI